MSKTGTSNVSQRLVALLLGALSLVIGIVATPSTVHAHASFVSSVPADGETVDLPVDEVTLTFSAAVQPDGAGFAVVDTAGRTVAVDAARTDDNQTYRLDVSPALTHGTYTVNWSVRSSDTHTFSGTLSFTVNAPAPQPATTPAPPATVAPSDTVPTDSVTADTAAIATGTTAPTENPAVNPPAATPSIPSPEPSDEQAAVASGIDAFGMVARLAGIVGALFAVGLAAMLLWVMQGSPSELSRVAGRARLAAILAAVGGVLAGVVAMRDGTPLSLAQWPFSAPWLVAALRCVGGVAIVAAIAAPRWKPVTADLANGHHGVLAWDDRPTRPVLAAGVAALLLSYWFDGHSLSVGNVVVHGLVNSAHVVAAGIWVAGVATLFASARKQRSGDAGATRFAAMVLRFSSIATLALATVVVAGVAMAWMVLNQPSDLYRTPWGRTLLAKVVAVAVAVAIGAYNHIVIRPKLANNPTATTNIVAVLRIELVALAIAMVITAYLVSASPT